MRNRKKVPLEEMFDYISKNGLKAAAVKYSYTTWYLRKLASDNNSYCVAEYWKSREKDIVEFCKTHSRVEATERFGASKTYVSRLCKDNDISPYKHERDFRTLKRDCYRLALSASDSTLSKAGAEIGVSKQRVSEFLTDCGFVQVWIKRDDFSELQSKYQQKSDEWKSARSSVC